MLIKTRLRLIALIPVAFALLIGGGLWVSWISNEQARKDATIAEDVLRSNFELNVLTQEYILYGGARIENQLRVQNQAMADLLASLTDREEVERELIAALRKEHQDLMGLHDLLLTGTEQAKEQLAGALLVKAQNLRAKTRQYADLQYLHVVETQNLADQGIMGALILLAGLSAMLVSLLAARLMRGLRQLSEGVRRVADGDLGHQIALGAADEVGALSASFNSMAQRLQDSYASIDQLNTEIAKRQQAETEIRRLNADLEQRVHSRTRELEATNKELEAFTYSVSHDLRAPLRAVDGFSRKVLFAYGEKLDAEARRQLQVVRDNAQKMGTLIDDLLSFSRMGRREMAWQALDMDAMVKGVTEELRAAEPQRAIEFTVSALPRAWGDAAMLRQVWVNLLSNAVKFSGQRALAHITVGGEVEGQEALYWVKDDGAGFDMQYAGKLFGVFQRLHRQDEFEGTGVGLAISQRILHRHAGRIWGEGRPDAGATFSFTLPLQASSNPVTKEPTS